MTEHPFTEQCSRCGGALQVRLVETRTKHGAAPWQWTEISLDWVPVPHKCEGPLVLKAEAAHG